MKNIDVINAFLNNDDENAYMSTAHVSFRGNRLWSYNTVIAEKQKSATGDWDILLINKTKYSVTTSKHQTYLNRALAAVASKYQIVEIPPMVLPNTQHLYNL